MGDQQRITLIGNGALVRQGQTTFGLHSNVTLVSEVMRSPSNAAVILAANGWKRKWKGGIFGSGARGVDAMA